MDIVKFGGSSKLKINQSIGLFGLIQHQKDGVIELQEIYDE